MKRSIDVICIFVISLVLADRPAGATVIAAYTANADPTTEGFTLVTFSASATTTPLANDQGHPAWSIATATQISQYSYESSAVSAPVQSMLATQGFLVTATVRPILGIAPTYNSTNVTTVGGFDYDDGSVRWEVDTGINANGDIVVVIPTTIDNAGPGESIESHGASFTLTGSGSTYHTLQLSYSPVTRTASLFVDGVDELNGYTGETSFVQGFTGLVFGADSGGTMNYASVTLATVPEPTSILTFAAAAAIGLIGRKTRMKMGR